MKKSPTGNVIFLNTKSDPLLEISENVFELIKPFDLDSLLTTLAKYSISKADLLQLEIDIERDNQLKLNEDMGPNVCLWIGNMLIKAVKKEWSIPVMLASEFLSGSLSRYYDKPFR